MEYFKIRLKQKSGLGSCLSADMLFGHIIWQVQYREGEQAVEAMLEEFKKNPLFLLSNALPEGYLPRPVLPANKLPLPPPSEKQKWLKEREAGKQFKKSEWIPLDFFWQHRESFEAAACLQLAMKPEYELKKENVTRNTINRQTGRALDGLLWSDSYSWLVSAPGNTHDLIVYVCALQETYNREWFTQIFAEISQSGFGKDISTGKGQFVTTGEELTPAETELFRFTGSHFISLSHCAGGNLHPLAYTLFTKYGRLGGMYGQCGIDGRLVFAKKPVVFYKQGSSFLKGQESVYGKMIPGVHREQRIVQYGYAFPLYFHYAGDKI
jgi:CRISPR type III-A-associated RAMP protein Csm4